MILTSVSFPFTSGGRSFGTTSESFWLWANCVPWVDPSQTGSPSTWDCRGGLQKHAGSSARVDVPAVIVLASHSLAHTATLTSTLNKSTNSDESDEPALRYGHVRSSERQHVSIAGSISDLSNQ